MDPPPPPPGYKPKGPGSFFEIAGAEIGDLNAILDFPGSWGLELRHAHARVTLKQDGTDPEHPTFGFDAGPVLAAGGGWLRILDDFVLPFDKVAINRVGTTPEWSDDIFLDLAEADTGRSKLVGKGFFTGIYGATSVPGIKLHAEFAQAGDALTAVVAGGGLKIEGLTISGDDAGIKADLYDTFAALKVKAAFRGLDAKFDTYRALGIGFDLGFDAGGGQGGRERLRVRRARRRQDAPGRQAGHQHDGAGRQPGVRRLPHRKLRPARAARDGGRQAARPHRRARRSRAQVRAPAAGRSEVLAAARKRAAERGAHQRQRDAGRGSRQDRRADRLRHGRDRDREGVGRISNAS